MYCYKVVAKGFMYGVTQREGTTLEFDAPLDPKPSWLEPIKTTSDKKVKERSKPFVAKKVEQKSSNVESL